MYINLKTEKGRHIYNMSISVICLLQIELLKFWKQNTFNGFNSFSVDFFVFSIIFCTSEINIMDEYYNRVDITQAKKKKRKR